MGNGFVNTASVNVSCVSCLHVNVDWSLKLQEQNTAFFANGFIDRKLIKKFPFLFLRSLFAFSAFSAVEYGIFYCDDSFPVRLHRTVVEAWHNKKRRKVLVDRKRNNFFPQSKWYERWCLRKFLFCFSFVETWGLFLESKLCKIWRFLHFCLILTCSGIWSPELPCNCAFVDRMDSLDFLSFNHHTCYCWHDKSEAKDSNIKD